MFVYTRFAEKLRFITSVREKKNELNEIFI